MANSDKTSIKNVEETVNQPVRSWRTYLNRAGAIVSRPWRRYRTDIFLGYVVVALGAFIVLAVLASTTAYFAFDLTITKFVQTFNPLWFSSLMVALSWIGFSPESYVISALILLFLYASGLKWETVVSIGSLILGTILVYGIKILVDRPRPSSTLVKVLIHLKDYSFPSGHVWFFVTFFGFMLFLTFSLLKSSWWRTILLIVLGVMVAFIGVSRIYEGEHWSSDVLGAYLLGTVWLSLSILVYRWGKTRFFVDQPVAKETRVNAS